MSVGILLSSAGCFVASDLSDAVLVTMEFIQRSSKFSIANEAKNNKLIGNKTRVLSYYYITVRTYSLLSRWSVHGRLPCWHRHWESGHVVSRKQVKHDQIKGANVYTAYMYTTYLYWNSKTNSLLILKKLEDTIYKIKVNFCCNFLHNSLDSRYENVWIILMIFVTPNERVNNSNVICDPKWHFRQLSQEFLTASLALNIY